MKDILESIHHWQEEGKEFCLARVIDTWRSAPRPVGSAMIITKTGEMAGSVSGGCIEKSVVAAAGEIFEGGNQRVLSFGVKDEDAWNVGLSCGGKIEVLVQLFPAFSSEENSNLWTQLESKLKDGQAVAWISGLDAENPYEQLISPGEGSSVKEEPGSIALEPLRQGLSRVISHENKRYFVQSFPIQNRLIIIGSAHITSELLILAKMHDFETIVIDPRDTFANKTMFSVKPDQLFVNWPQEILKDLNPDENTFVVVLSHDPKIDDAAMEILLNTNVPYIGALGSKRTHAKRTERLSGLGFSEEQTNRINGPVGIDINALTATEIALSIMGEIVSVKNKGRLAK